MWINAFLDAPMMWALDNKSMLIYHHVAFAPGVVRIKKNMVQWGKSYDESANTPPLILPFNELPVAGEKTHLVLAIQSYDSREDSDNKVTVVDSAYRCELTDGVYTNADESVSVIDMNHTSLIPWSSKSELINSRYEESNAYVNGGEFLVSHLRSSRAAREVLNRLEHMCVELDEAAVRKFSAIPETIAGVSSAIYDELHNRAR